MKKIVGIKLGSATLVNQCDGSIKTEFIAGVCEQIAELMRRNFGVFVVTSGAIASDPKKDRSSNLRSAVGQARIMSKYATSLERFGLDAAQILLTDEQLVDKKSSKTRLTKKIILEALSIGVVPIINANDVIDNEEIKALEHCADNDKLFKLTCLLVGADVAIIGFDQSGFLDLKKRVIHRVETSNIETVLQYAQGGSSLGHGGDGMRTKILSLAELSNCGIQTHLSPAKEENFILRSVANEKNFGTIFV